MTYLRARAGRPPPLGTNIIVTRDLELHGAGIAVARDLDATNTLPE